MTSREAYRKAVEVQKRLPELEHIIMQDAYLSMCYAINVIKGRWLDAESFIIQDAYYAYFYARDILKERWPDAEPIIMQDADAAYRYALNIIKGRWPEAEPSIMQNTQSAYDYATSIIKGRWTEAEQIIAQSKHVNDYIKRFFDEPVATKNQVDIIQWERKKILGYFAPDRLFTDKVSLLDMVIE